MQRSVLLGEFEFTLDAKNRVAIPARLRPAFAEGVVLTRFFEGCLAVFPPTEWDHFVEERMGDLPAMSREGREMRRFLFGMAGWDDLDRQGRITIPGNLLEYAGLARDVTIVGVQDHVEIWDRAAYAAYRSHMEEGADAAADQPAHQ